MIAPTDTAASDPVIFSISETGEPTNYLPALAALLIGQWREKKAEQAEATRQQGGDTKIDEEQSK